MLPFRNVENRKGGQQIVRREVGAVDIRCPAERSAGILFYILLLIRLFILSPNLTAFNYFQ